MKANCQKEIKVQAPICAVSLDSRLLHFTLIFNSILILNWIIGLTCHLEWAFGTLQNDYLNRYLIACMFSWSKWSRCQEVRLFALKKLILTIMRINIRKSSKLCSWMLNLCFAWRTCKSLQIIEINNDISPVFTRNILWVI